MDEFSHQRTDGEGAAPNVRRGIYLVLVFGVIAWTIYCGFDLLYFRRLIHTDPQYTIDLAGLMAPEEAEKTVFGAYAAVRLFWWCLFSLPAGLVAILIKPHPPRRGG